VKIKRATTPNAAHCLQVSLFPVILEPEKARAIGLDLTRYHRLLELLEDWAAAKVVMDGLGGKYSPDDLDAIGLASHELHEFLKEPSP
jgi:hypothetical protein